MIKLDLENSPLIKPEETQRLRERMGHDGARLIMDLTPPEMLTTIKRLEGDSRDIWIDGIDDTTFRLVYFARFARFDRRWIRTERQLMDMGKSLEQVAYDLSRAFLLESGLEGLHPECTWTVKTGSIDHRGSSVTRTFVLTRSRDPLETEMRNNGTTHITEWKVQPPTDPRGTQLAAYQKAFGIA